MGLRRRRPHAPAMPAHSCGLLIPVLAPGGGAGRSTLTALLAQASAPKQRTAVVDTAHPNASRWRDWVTRFGSLPLPLPEDAGPQEVFAACSSLRAPGQATVQVLADTAPRPCPTRTPIGVEAGRCYARLLGHGVVVVDTDAPLLTTPLPPAGSGTVGGWLLEADATPVLCVPASLTGVDNALMVVTALEQANLTTDRLVVAVVGIAASEVPRRVLAGLALLDARVGGVVRIPHDSRIRATGRPSLDRVGRPLQRAVDQLLTAAQTAAARPAVTTHRGPDTGARPTSAMPAAPL